MLSNSQVNHTVRTKEKVITIHRYLNLRCTLHFFFQILMAKIEILYNVTA